MRTSCRIGPKTSLSIMAMALVVSSACGGDDGGGGTQPQTEQGAVDAAVKATRGALTNRSGDVLNFLNEECRASVDDDEIRDALLFAQLFFQSDEFDIDEIDFVGTATGFTGDTATVEVEIVGPEDADLGLLEIDNDDFELIYENGKWVDEDCDFDDSASSPEALDDELEAAGLAATQDDPVPNGVVAPVGAGFSVVTTDYVADAFDLITEAGGVEPFLDDGERIALLALDIGYAGSEEPIGLGRIQMQLVGTDGVAIDQTSCGNMTDQTYAGGREVFSGAATSAVACFAAPPDDFDETPLVSIQAVFGGRSVFFSPTTTGGAAEAIVAAAGPSPDGDLTDDRTAPSQLGTAVDIDEGWTMTVKGLDTDVAPTGDFDEPPPVGSSYVLLDVTLEYDGEESPASPFQVRTGLVGDSNVAATEQCRLNDVPDRLDDFADVFPGGTISGTVCFTVTDSDLDSLVAYATAESFGDDREFFAVS